ncbi:MAG: ribosome silencing factor [Candidatus Omnitrophica bacterium]|nr:ribosome silencing factor [Candidatus Omnitrophota bacterium]
MQARKVIALVQAACEEKKGGEVIALDLRKHNAIAGYFVLATGNSDRHVRALADNVMDRLAEKGLDPIHVEGKEEGRWILLDYGEVIVHLFYHETRKFYSLERLWGHAKVLS